jgi:hypothetical protein
MHCLWIWRARRFSHHVLICKLFGIDRLKVGVSEVKLRKFFGHSFLATFFKLFHASFHGVLDHDDMGQEDVFRVHVIIRVKEVSVDGSSAFIGLSAK